MGIDNYHVDQGNNIFTDTVFVQYIPQHSFEHESDSTLGIGHTDVERHGSNVIHLFSGIVAHQDIPYLWSVSVGDDQVIPFADEKDEVLNGLNCIFFLFLNGSLFILPQKGVASQSCNGKFVHRR